MRHVAHVSGPPNLHGALSLVALVASNQRFPQKGHKNCQKRKLLVRSVGDRDPARVTVGDRRKPIHHHAHRRRWWWFLENAIGRRSGWRRRGWEMKHLRHCCHWKTKTKNKKQKPKKKDLFLEYKKRNKKNEVVFFNWKEGKLLFFWSWIYEKGAQQCGTWESLAELLFFVMLKKWRRRWWCGEKVVGKNWSEEKRRVWKFYFTAQQ